MKKLLDFLHKKITSESIKIALRLSTRIMKWGIILSLLIAVFYIAYKLSLSEMKAVFSYYYSKYLVSHGSGQRAVHIINHLGNKDTMLAADLINDPFTLLEKHNFYWTILKGFFIGYIFFKIFGLLVFLWFYIKSHSYFKNIT